MNVVHLKKPRIFYENQYFCEGFEEILHYGMLRCRPFVCPSVCPRLAFFLGTPSASKIGKCEPWYIAWRLFSKKLDFWRFLLPFSLKTAAFFYERMYSHEIAGKLCADVKWRFFFWSFFKNLKIGFLANFFMKVSWKSRIKSREISCRRDFRSWR